MDRKDNRATECVLNIVLLYNFKKAYSYDRFSLFVSASFNNSATKENQRMLAENYFIPCNLQQSDTFIDIDDSIIDGTLESFFESIEKHLRQYSSDITSATSDTSSNLNINNYSNNDHYENNNDHKLVNNNTDTSIFIHSSDSNNLTNSNENGDNFGDCDSVSGFNNNNAHQLALLSAGAFICGIDGCRVTFARQCKRNEHIRNVHDTPIACPYGESCSSLIKPANLKEHYRSVHAKLKGKCQSCGKIMLVKSLIQHRKICSSGAEDHHQPIEKKFKCDHEGCRATFRTPKEKGIHFQNVHKPQVPCPEVGCAKLVKPRNLADHLKNVHKIESRSRVRCHYCRVEVTKINFKKHVQYCGGCGQSPGASNSVDLDNGFLSQESAVLRDSMWGEGALQEIRRNS